MQLAIDCAFLHISCAVSRGSCIMQWSTAVEHRSGAPRCPSEMLSWPGAPGAPGAVLAGRLTVINGGGSGGVVGFCRGRQSVAAISVLLGCPLFVPGCWSALVRSVSYQAATSLFRCSCHPIPSCRLPSLPMVPYVMPSIACVFGPVLFT